jgi:hypothetical protein
MKSCGCPGSLRSPTHELCDGEVRQGENRGEADRVHEHHRMLELLDGGEEHEHGRRDQCHQSARMAHGRLRSTWSGKRGGRATGPGEEHSGATEQEDDVRAQHAMLALHHHRGDELDHEHRRRVKRQ